MPNRAAAMLGPSMKLLLVPHRKARTESGGGLGKTLTCIGRRQGASVPVGQMLRAGLLVTPFGLTTV